MPFPRRSRPQRIRIVTPNDPCIAEALRAYHAAIRTCTDHRIAFRDALEDMHADDWRRPRALSLFEAVERTLRNTTMN